MASVDDQIAALQAQVTALTSGGSGTTGGTYGSGTPNYTAYVQNSPDILAAYNDYGVKQGTTLQAFGQWHWDTFGQNEVNQGDTNRAQTPYGPADYSKAGTPTPTDQSTATGITDNATTTTNNAITTTTNAGDALTTAITGLGNNLTGMINAQAGAFTASQNSLLTMFQQQTASQSSAMADLTSQLQAAINGNGQGVKQPNYAAALDKNRILNGGGLSSTSLTGPTGVPTSSLPLGGTSLLGS